MDKEKAIPEQAIAALHEAGHFVLCWLFGFPPMTVNVTARGTGKVDFRRAINATPNEWRICLMGGYAAETLELKPELFLLLTGGIEGARKQGDRVDTKKAALLSQSAAEYDTAFITAHYLLNHYKDHLAEALKCLMAAKRITKTEAKALYDKWDKEPNTYYYPDKRTLTRCLERLNQKRAKQ